MLKLIKITFIIFSMVFTSVMAEETQRRSLILDPQEFRIKYPKTTMSGKLLLGALTVGGLGYASKKRYFNDLEEVLQTAPVFLIGSFFLISGLKDGILLSLGQSKSKERKVNLNRNEVKQISKELIKEYIIFRKNVKTSSTMKSVSVDKVFQKQLQVIECDKCESEVEKIKIIQDWITFVRQIVENDVLKYGYAKDEQAKEVLAKRLSDTPMKDNLRSILGENYSGVNYQIIHSFYVYEFFLRYEKKYGEGPVGHNL